MTKRDERTEFTPDQIDAIKRFVARVNERAERHIAATGMVSGAHWNAMRAELEELKKQEVLCQNQ